jgi:hypothetical protein
MFYIFFIVFLISIHLNSSQKIEINVVHSNDDINNNYDSIVDLFLFEKNNFIFFNIEILKSSLINMTKSGGFQALSWFNNNSTSMLMVLRNRSQVVYFKSEGFVGNIKNVPFKVNYKFNKFTFKQLNCMIPEKKNFENIWKFNCIVISKRLIEKQTKTNLINLLIEKSKKIKRSLINDIYF